MFEHVIEIEKNIQPINVVLDRMKEFLREELQTRGIYEYTQSLDKRVLLYFKICFYDSEFKIRLFDGIVVGELKMEYDDIMSRYPLKNALQELINAYFEERDRLPADLLTPCYDYYKRRFKVALKEEF